MCNLRPRTVHEHVCADLRRQLETKSNKYWLKISLLKTAIFPIANIKLFLERQYHLFTGEGFLNLDLHSQVGPTSIESAKLGEILMRHVVKDWGKISSKY